MSMSCLDCHDFMDGFNRGKREGAIEEFEHLKADIRFHGYYDERIEDLIDKHIAELKGEQE